VLVCLDADGVYGCGEEAGATGGNHGPADRHFAGAPEADEVFDGEWLGHGGVDVWLVVEA
jgi:hypothetical protein